MLKPQNPQTGEPAWGYPFFYPQPVAVTWPHPGLASHGFFWQVFWLPRPLSDLPILYHMLLVRTVVQHAKRVPF